MIEKLIEKVFSTRNAAHLEHWRTKSFAAHMALGELYEALIESIDELVEAHQGVAPLVNVGELPVQTKVVNIVARLETDLEWISKNRKEITGDRPGIDNILQELEGVYMKALYKLKHLS